MKTKNKTLAKVCRPERTSYEPHWNKLFQPYYSRNWLVPQEL
nr:MAG TPA: hypothetical protein [Caudoviricetes sp.]